MPDRGRHVLGVERARDLQRSQPGLLRRVGRERRELLERARDDDLAGAVLVGGGEAVRLGLRDDLVAVAAEDGGHAGGGDGRRSGHRLAALADEHHRLLGGDDAGADGGGDLADAVARSPRRSWSRRRTGAGTGSAARPGPAPTSSGWATAVSRIVSASLVVPWATRSMPATVDSQRRRSSNPGTSSQGVRKPGV